MFSRKLHKHSALPIKLVIVLFAFMVSNFVHAEMVIVVHPNNNETVSMADIKKIFLGKTKSFPSGKVVIPLEPLDDKVRQEFLDKIIERNEAQLRAYWSRMIFTGKSDPPRKVASNEEVKALVAKEERYIGIIDSSALDSSVKAVSF